MPSAETELHCPELQSYRAALADAAARIDALVEALSSPQMNWRPAPGKWSIAECIQHLSVTNRLYLPGLDRAIARGRQRGILGQAPFSHGAVGRWFLGALEPPPRRSYPAPKKFTPPTADLDAAQVMAEFHEIDAELRHRIEAADGLHLGKLKLSSPAMALLRFRLGTAFAILAAHERRHLWQAEQIKNSEGFPQ